jgi:hypothetical protein
MDLRVCNSAFKTVPNYDVSPRQPMTADGAQCLLNEITRGKEHDLAGGLKRQRQLARRKEREFSRRRVVMPNPNPFFDYKVCS